MWMGNSVRWCRTKKQAILAIICGMLSVLLCACGYSKEEKQRMKGIEAAGRKNAVHYIETKYGFTPEIDDVEICMEREDSVSNLWANGYVLVTMHHENETFQVHINGEEETADGMDNFQQTQILEDARKYLEALLGYEIYDIYLQYQEPQTSEKQLPKCHKDGLIREYYEAGTFEDVLQRWPVNMRVDDCIDQDLTDIREKNPDAVSFFAEYTGKFGLKAILISYRSIADYESGTDHTYGENGILDFGIWNDGLYICSYVTFEEEGMTWNHFTQQELDGMKFSYGSRNDGEEPAISKGIQEWKELGETKEEPVSEIYSVRRDSPGEITVYMPTEQYGRSPAVFIQHFEDNRWWQYECNVYRTEDKRYVFFTYHGISDGDFDFAVFP